MANNTNIRRSSRKTQDFVTQVSNTPESDEIDLLELWILFKKKFLYLIILVILCGGITFGYTKTMIAPTYSCSESIYLTPLVSSETGIADYSSLNSNTKLVSNVVSLLQQNDLLTRVAEASGLDSAKEVKQYLTVSNTNDTEVITVSAITTDPRLSKKIVKNTVDFFIEMMKDNLNVKNIEIVDSARLNFTPVGPNIIKNTALGALIGIVLYSAYITFLLLTDNHLKTKEQVEKYLGLPVLGEFPLEKKGM